MKKTLIAAALAMMCGLSMYAADAALKFGCTNNNKQTVIKEGVITVKNTDGQHGGVNTAVDFNQQAPARIAFSGESKCTSCKGIKSPNDYSLYADLTYMDGTKEYGIIAPFDPARKDWQKVSKEFMPKKAVKQVRFYVLFRFCTGEAQFRNITLKEVK